MAISDIMGQYLQNRVDSAVQPFSDPEAYLRQRLLDDEEERKKKEREEAAKAALEQQQAQQKAIDDAQQAQQQTAASPVAPGQTVAQIPAGMASPNPYGSAIAQGQTSEGPAPSQGGPAPQVQEQGNIEEQRRLQQAQAEQAQQAAQQAPATPVAPAPQPVAQQPQAAPQPAAPQQPQQFTGQGISMPAAPQQAAPQMTMQERIAAAAQRAQERAGTAQPTTQSIGELPQFGPGVQVASTEPGAGVAEAARAQQVTQSPWASALETGKNDLTALGKILAGDAPEDIKSEAQDRLLNMKLDRDQQKKVEKIVAGVEKNDPKAINDLTRELKTRSQEGSYVKAILFSRLGLNKLAEEEQMKLGGGTTYSSFMGMDGQPYTVRVNGRGGVEKAFDSFGRAVDETQLAAINAGYMGQKGSETGKQQYKDEKGDIYTFSTVPGRLGGVYTNATTGRQSATAPKGLVPLSYQSPQERAAVQSSKQVMDKMRAENTKSEAQGAGTRFTEEQIQSAGDAASAAVFQGRAPAPVVESTATKSFTDPSIKIISGARSTSEQQALYDQSVAAGTPGKLPNGNPVAKPGTSAHEGGGAIDVDSKSLTTAGRRELAMKGYYQPLPNDPNHWELLPGREAPAAAKTAPSSAIRQQAQAIYNGDEKAPTGMGSDNYRVREVMDEVRRIAQEQGKPFDPTIYTVREKTRKDFSGSGQAAKSVQSMNVAIDHLDTLQQAATALKNGQIPIFNKYSNMYAKNTGSAAPTDFDSTKKIVSSEVAKAVTGSQMALADREEVQKNLDNALTPEQLAGVIKRTQELLAGQLKGLRTTYESVGLKDFDSKLTPRTKEILGQAEGGGGQMRVVGRRKKEEQ